MTPRLDTSIYREGHAMTSTKTGKTGSVVVPPTAELAHEQIQAFEKRHQRHYQHLVRRGVAGTGLPLDSSGILVGAGKTLGELQEEIEKGQEAFKLHTQLGELEDADEVCRAAAEALEKERAKRDAAIKRAEQRVLEAMETHRVAARRAEKASEIRRKIQTMMPSWVVDLQNERSKAAARVAMAENEVRREEKQLLDSEDLLRRCGTSATNYSKEEVQSQIDRQKRALEGFLAEKAAAESLVVELENDIADSLQKTAPWMLGEEA